MSTLIAWARDLVALALFGYLLELLLPSRVMEGYVRLVVGLVLLAALVSPLLTWLRPNRLLGMDLPGASAQGVKAVLTDENRYANGESSQILTVFSGQAAAAAEAALGGLRGASTRSVRVHVVTDVSEPDYGQIDAVNVVLSGTGTGLVGRAQSVVAATLGVPEDVVEVHLVPGAPRGRSP